MLAIAVMALAMGTRGLLGNWFGESVPYLFALPAVFIVGWAAGLLPALLSVVLALVWLLEPWLEPTLSAAAGWRPTLYFLPSALLLAYFGARLGRREASSDPLSAQEQRVTLAWLRAVIALAVVVPAAMLVAAGWGLYLQTMAEAEAKVDRAVRISEEHALKVFETDVALLSRILEMLGDDADDTLLARERQLYEQLDRMSRGLAQLQGIFVMGSSGRMIATNRLFPAPHAIDYSDRAAFKHHRSGGAEPYITDVLISRATGEPFFDLSLRRTRADGSFGGTVSTSMLPQYFSSFYREISGNVAALHISLRRADGVLLAGWPQALQPEDAPAVVSARGRAASSLPFGASVSGTLGRESHLSASRQLGSFPMYVTASMDESAVLATWYDQMVLLLALTFPTAAGLVYIGWIALRRTQRALHMVQTLKEEVAARQRAEESLRQAQKLEALGHLTGGVAHDFNNLLMVISSNLHLHKRRSPEIASGARPLEAIERAVAAGAKLTRQLLSFSRRQAIRPTIVHLPEWLPGIVELIKPALGAGVAVELGVAPTVAPIELDIAELELALLNLAINAKDAMPEGGRLLIRAADAAPDESPDPHKRFVLIAVQDTGAGIEPALIQRVFEPFFTTKPVGQGTGLGLSQVYGLCQSAGGTAKLQSEPGKGTTVCLFFPAAQARVPAVPQSAPAEPESFPGLKVLLVEDNPEVAAATQALLESMGCRVRRAADGDEAVAWLQTQQVDFNLLVSDIVMPGAVDGIKLAALTRQTHPHVAVLLMSGYSEHMAMAASLRLDVMPKPCPPSELAAAMRTALARVP